MSGNHYQIGQGEDNQDWLDAALDTIKIEIGFGVNQLPKFIMNVTEAKAAITTKIAESELEVWKMWQNYLKVKETRLNVVDDRIAELGAALKGKP